MGLAVAEIAAARFFVPPSPRPAETTDLRVAGSLFPELSSAVGLSAFSWDRGIFYPPFPTTSLRVACDSPSFLPPFPPPAFTSIAELFMRYPDMVPPFWNPIFAFAFWILAFSLPDPEFDVRQTRSRLWEINALFAVFYRCSSVLLPPFRPSCTASYRGRQILPQRCSHPRSFFAWRRSFTSDFRRHPPRPLIAGRTKPPGPLRGFFSPPGRIRGYFKIAWSSCRPLFPHGK